MRSNTAKLLKKPFDKYKITERKKQNETNQTCFGPRSCRCYVYGYACWLWRDQNATNGTETSEKVLSIATIGETTTLSPLYMIADNRPTQKLLYEGLVKYVDGEIQPVLAEDWKLSDDGTQLTFYLRKGVTFHDGEPFNAEAAIANIESWHINPSFTSLPGVVNYTNIEAVDEYTIRLTYDTPYFAYINDFAGRMYAL